MRSGRIQAVDGRSHPGWRRLVDEWPLILAVGLAAWLRGFQLLDQIPIGDEWHALDATWRRPLLDLLTSLDARYSTPMVIFEKIALATTGMSELSVYLPLFICGVALVMLFPLMVRPWVGKRRSDLFALLLSISPMLILYSRFFRPYILTVFLGGACLYLAWRWGQENRVIFGIAYAICGAMAVFLQVVSVVFVAAPFLFFAVADLRLKGDWRLPRPVGQFIGIGCLFAVLTSLFVGAPLLGSTEMITKKVGQQSVSLNTITRSANLFSGSVNGWIVGTVVGLALFGLFVLVRRNRSLTMLVLSASVFQCLAVIVVAPTSIGSSLVFARYMVLALPFFLLCVASGFVSLMDGLFQRWRTVKPLVPAGIAFIGVMLLSGPLLPALYLPNNWTSAVLQAEMMKDDPKSRIRHSFENSRATEEGISPFYEFLNDHPAGSLRVVEVPWFFRLTLNRNPWLQQFHRQTTLVGITSCISSHSVGKGEFPCQPERFQFGNLVYLDDLQTLEKRSVDYIIIHRDLYAEVDAAEVKRPGLARTLALRSPEISKLLAYFQTTVGSPCYEDNWVTVFALNASSIRLIQSSSYSSPR